MISLNNKDEPIDRRGSPSLTEPDLDVSDNDDQISSIGDKKFEPAVEISDTDSQFVPSEFNEEMGITNSDGIELDTENPATAAPLKQGFWQKFLFFLK